MTQNKDSRLRDFALTLHKGMEKSAHKNLKTLSGKNRNNVIQDTVAFSGFLMGLALGARRPGEVVAMFAESNLPGFDPASMADIQRSFDEQVLG